MAGRRNARQMASPRLRWRDSGPSRRLRRARPIRTRIPYTGAEVEALRAELGLAAGPDEQGRPDQAAVIALMCHAERDGVFRLLADLGAHPVESAAELRAIVPRLTPRPHRG